MICYRDMTFCASDCENKECQRCVTDEVRDAAEEWWGGKDYPIAKANFHLSCEEYKPKQKPLYEIEK